MNVIRVLARPLLASVFIVEAVDALRNPDEHVATLEPVEGALDKASESIPGLPSNKRNLVRLHAGITLGAGVLFALGKAPRTSATVLALAATPAAVVANPVRTKAQRKANLPNLLAKAAAIAGLTFAAGDRRGAPSLNWRYRNWQGHRADIAKVKAQAEAHAQSD